MSWINVSGDEIAEEKVETFETKSVTTGKVTGINTITSRRLVKRLDWERITDAPTFTYDDFVSEVDIGTWLGVHCIEHKYDWDPISKALTEWKQTEGASSWTIVRNDYEDVPTETDPEA